MAKKTKIKTAKKKAYMSTAKLNARIKKDTKKSGHESSEIGKATKRIANLNKELNDKKTSASRKKAISGEIKAANKSKGSHQKAKKKLDTQIKKDKQTVSNRKKSDRAKKNGKVIARKISENKSQDNVGHAMIFRTDQQSSAIVFLSPVPETEDNDIQVTANAMPHDEPIATHSQQTSKTINITARIMGKNDKETREKYNILKLWKAQGCEITYRGRIYYKHCLFTALHREYNKQETALNITFTLQFVDWAYLKLSKKKNGKKVSTGSKTKKTQKTDPKKYVTSKSGTTYWDLSRKYGNSVAWMEKNNKYPARKIPIGVKIRVL